MWVNECLQTLEQWLKTNNRLDVSTMHDVLNGLENIIAILACGVSNVMIGNAGSKGSNSSCTMVTDNTVNFTKVDGDLNADQ